jgi:exosome complex RNA-binding protein Rrp4
MKNVRKGLGKGLGCGYKNIAPMDSHIHSLSAKGMKTYIVPLNGRIFVTAKNKDDAMGKAYNYMEKKIPNLEESPTQINISTLGVKTTDDKDFINNSLSAKGLPAYKPKKAVKTTSWVKKLLPF